MPTNGSIASAERAGPLLSRSLWLDLALRIARRLRVGVLTIEFPDLSRRRFRGQEAGPRGHLRLHRLRAIRRLATGGALAFGEAYVDGDWDSPDLPRLLHLLALNEEAYASWRTGRPWARTLPRLTHAMRPNTRQGSRRNVEAHYDLGNAFYGRWLDSGMTYSSALFERPGQTLEQAQRAKLLAVARVIGLEPSHHLLEIGCGWGSFAELAAAEVGARVTAITVSPHQHAYAAARIQAAGLGERVEIRLQDYREVEGCFDRIASIEMMEAVGERYWPSFFRKLRGCLTPAGVAALQTITIADRRFERYRTTPDFIQRHVFPGGMLASPGVLDQQIRRSGLATADQVSFGPDYARTLALWSRRFQAAWPELRWLGFDERFRRLWTYYLAYCEAGFRAGFTEVARLTLRPA